MGVMQPQIQYVTTSDGVGIAYCVIGDGEPFVYASNAWGDVHWYQHNEPTREQVDRLVASGRRVVRYDARGTGSSDRNVSDFSLEARVLDLEAVVDQLALERYPLCGYVHGGATAVLYAVRHAERVSHLMLVNAFATGSAYYELVPVAHTVTGLRDMAEKQWEFFTLTIASGMTGYRDPATAQRTAELFRSSMAPAAFLAWVEETRTMDLSGLLPSVAVPTLVVADALGSSALGLVRPLAVGIPGARFVSTDDYIRECSLFLGDVPHASTAPPVVRAGGTAVILFVDIAGSTALTERLGDAAFRDRSRALDGALRAAVRAAGGTPVEGKVMGDGLMATFGAARQAIEAALRCRDASARHELPLHLGVHAGDVIREGDGAYGGAVNIAARICDASAPGEILVSGTVRDLARTSAGAAFEDRGERDLKGVAEPVRVYAVRGDTQA